MDIRDNQDNLGGISSVWIVEARSLGTMPKLDDSSTLDIGVLEDMAMMPVHTYRVRYNETESETDQGNLINKIFTNTIPQDTDAYRDFLNRFSGKEVELIYKCVNGEYWLCFDRDYPGVFMKDFDSGMEPPEGKLNTVNITSTTFLPRRKILLD